MYYLSDKEKEFIRRNLEKVHIEGSLRGWNWSENPVRPYSEKMLLSAWEFSSPCPTFRDVYLRRKIGIRVPPLKSQIFGFFIHKIVQKVFFEARKQIYLGKKNVEINMDFSNILSKIKEDFKISDEDLEKMREYGEKIIEFEERRIQSRIDDVLATYSFINEESLAFLSIPFITELIVDGRMIGLSKNIRADCFGISSLVYDIKFGKPYFRHKLQVTAYALAIESNYFIPINFGCLVYVSFRDGIKINREIFVINEKLRSSFIDARDNLQHILLHDKDPGISKRCPKNCVFREYCEKI